MHSSLRHVDIDGKAVGLLVVQHKVFQAAGYTIRLCCFDVGHYHFACQEGVFAHVLKSSSVQWGALDVDAWTEHDVFATKGKLFAYSIAVGGGEGAVPSGGEAGEGRKGDDVVVCPLGRTPCVPLQFLAHSVRPIVHVELADAQTGHTCAGELALSVEQLNFFVGGHATECIFDSFLDGSLWIKIDLCRCCQGCHGE